MQLVEIYTELDALNGMNNILYLHYGNFMNQVKFLMVRIGIIGELNKKFSGKTTINYG